MIPKWAWPAGILIATLCYTLNSAGHGWVSFIATVTLTRLAIGKQVQGTEAEKWVAAFVVAFVGTIAYGLVGGMLKSDRVAPDLNDN